MSAPPQPEPCFPAGRPLSTRSVWTVLTLALIARLVPFFSLVAHSSVTWIYGRGLETGFVAHALLAGQGFASPFGGHTGPTALVSPGYVLLVAAIFRVFGDASGTSAVVILLAQIALGVLAVWLIMRLADTLGGRRAALLAGCFFALWPPLLWVPTIFWDTSLTLCLVPALVLIPLRLRERPSLLLWLAFGVLCSLAVLVNLALCPSVLAVFCWAVWNSSRRRTGVLLAAFAALLLYAPWPLRNARAFHAFIPLRTTVGLELWMGNREGATGFLDESIFPLYNRQELTAYLQRGEVAYMRDKSGAASAAIRRHPRRFVALTAKRFVRFWLGTGTHGGAALYAVGATLTTLIGLAGLIALLRRHAWANALLFALPLLVFPLPYYVTHAEFRYRLALDPLLTTLAAYFVTVRLRHEADTVARVGDPVLASAAGPVLENPVPHA